MLAEKAKPIVLAFAEHLPLEEILLYGFCFGVDASGIQTFYDSRSPVRGYKLKDGVLTHKELVLWYAPHKDTPTPPALPNGFKPFMYGIYEDGSPTYDIYSFHNVGDHTEADFDAFCSENNIPNFVGAPSHITTAWTDMAFKVDIATNEILYSKKYEQANWHSLTMALSQLGDTEAGELMTAAGGILLDKYGINPLLNYDYKAVTERPGNE